MYFKSVLMNIRDLSFYVVYFNKYRYLMLSCKFSSMYGSHLPVVVAADPPATPERAAYTEAQVTPANPSYTQMRERTLRELVDPSDPSGRRALRSAHLMPPLIDHARREAAEVVVVAHPLATPERAAFTEVPVTPANPSYIQLRERTLRELEDPSDPSGRRALRSARLMPPLIDQAAREEAEALEYGPFVSCN